MIHPSSSVLSSALLVQLGGALCVLGVLCGCATTGPVFEKVRVHKVGPGPEDLEAVAGPTGNMLVTGVVCRRDIFAQSNRSGKLMGLDLGAKDGAFRELYRLPKRSHAPQPPTERPVVGRLCQPPGRRLTETACSRGGERVGTGLTERSI